MSQELQLAPVDALPVARPQPTALDILNSAIQGGITSENVAVVKELIAMQREEADRQAKAKFNRAFFELKQEIAQMDLYADKQATRKGGGVAYTYCSENELQSKLEPVLARNGFAMMCGQGTDGQKVSIQITLIHRDGHEEKRDYSVRPGRTNEMKDETAVDTGATTSAWRHLVIKMFGLKSRICEADDARNLGGVIDRATAERLEERIALTNSNKAKMLHLSGVKTIAEIPQSKYEVLDAILLEKERAGR